MSLYGTLQDSQMPDMRAQYEGESFDFPSAPHRDHFNIFGAIGNIAADVFGLDQVGEDEAVVSRERLADLQAEADPFSGQSLYVILAIGGVALLAVFMAAQN